MKWLCCLLLAVTSLGATALKRVTDENGDTLAVVVPAEWGVQFRSQIETADLTEYLKQLREPVKLNIVAAGAESASAARAAIREFYPAGSRPAVSVVIGATRRSMPIEFDAVEATNDGGRRGPLLFISGQAEKGATPAEAATKTLAGLAETLKFLGSLPSDVVQARCFLNPVSARAEVTRVAEEAGLVPVSFVEWRSDLPAEIELVANGVNGSDAAPAIEYLTPPGKMASPLFARVVRVNRGDLIFIGDLYAAEPGDGAAQVESIFAQLQDVLKQTGSDLRHLVKATYYVSDDDASKQLNAIRPKFYEPKRPPAASKAMVPSVGRRDRSISIDMIAVPTTQPTP
jgi:enamine deaminase RidA (YjgF/YER057c/UK114 family)